MSEIFIKLLNMSMTASWIILAVTLLRLLLKKAPKWLNCVLWAVAAVRLICPYTIESVLSLIPSAETVSPAIMYSPAPVINSGVPVINNAVNPVISQTLAPDITDSINPVQVLTEIAAYVWLAGMCAMLIYAAVSFIVLRRRVSASIPLRDNIRICDGIGTPFVLGFFRPHIYLPSDMDESQTGYVTAHENAHLKRGDHLWKPLGFALLTVYWFNPLCWLAYAFFCRDIELACDEKVVREYDIWDKKAYSEALLSCSVPRKMITACPLAFSEVGVKRRIKSVLNYKKPAFRIIIAAVIACIVLAVCFLTNPAKEPELDNVESIMINGASVSDTEKSELVLMINNHKKTKFPVGADDPDSQSTAVEIRLADGSMWVLHNQNYNGIKLDINSGSDKRAIITRFNASGKAEDAWRIEASFNSDFEKWYNSQNNGSLQNDHSYREGLYLPCDNGADMIIIDDYGPVSITPDNDSITFDGLTAGDKIRIEVYLIQELYPIRAVIYSIEKLSDGEYGDIDADMISSLTELGWLDNKSKEAQETEQLTLEKVISLSKKGDALMWSDFDSYAHIETGSGLYIRVYTIDDTFSVWIGGGSTDEKPMYIYLAAGKQGEPRIDIRTDDVEAFIEKYKGSVISIKSLDEWSAFENSTDTDPSMQYFAHQYLSDILNGKINELSGVQFGSYSVIKEYTRRDDYYEYLIRFDVDIPESDVDTLPAGNGSYYVFGDGPQGAYLFSAEDLPINRSYTPAQIAIFMYLQMSGQYNFYPVDSASVSRYIIRIRGDESCTPTEMQNYAEEIFGIDNFTPGTDECVLSNGIYKIIGRGADIWSYRFISEIEDDGITTVTVRFYSDYARYKVSHTVDYKLSEFDYGYKFVSSEIIEPGVSEPYHTVG